MKRSLLVTLCLGAIAAAIVIALQKSGILMRPESIVAKSIFRSLSPNESVGPGQYLLVVGLALAVTWAMVEVREVARRSGLLFLLIADLLGAAWVLSFAGISFQPIPALLVTLLATLLAACVTATRAGRKARAVAELFAGRLSQSAIDRLTKSRAPDLTEPNSYEVSFVFCEIANEADLMEELPAAKCARLTRDFIACATELFLQEGGYLHAADGEGIHVLFGFPNATEAHAIEASRAALAFRERFATLAAKKPDSLGKIDLRIGINSGAVLATVPEETPRQILIAGQPFELARRLALANQIYGSQILIGPRTFISAGKEIVARPIDFLRSGEEHERLEIYELLALTGKASAEELARRDRFWTGIVYFRERRWNEAFAEFSRARRENGEEDGPLQWYLRRLEPLLLHMATEPAPVAEPLTPL